MKVLVVGKGAREHALCWRFSQSPKVWGLFCASGNPGISRTATPVDIAPTDIDLLSRFAELQKIDLTVVGSENPLALGIVDEFERRGLPFNQLQNNCSGKHAGMLATAVHLGLPTDNYVSPDHPIQKEIAATFARMAGLGRGLTTAIDGCSAPTFGVPLISLAVALSRLVSPWRTTRETGSRTAIDAGELAAIKWVVAAMTAHPELIGGSKGRLDTDLMRAAGGRLISKVGAEAVHVLGVAPGEAFPWGLGIAIKIEDGAKRAVAPVVIETLAQLGIIGRPELEKLTEYHHPHIVNHRRIRVGEVRAVFDLEFGRTA